MNTCPECGKVADDAEAVRDWYWLRRGAVGFWACSMRCLVEHVDKAQHTVFENWLPTPEDEARMKE